MGDTFEANMPSLVKHAMNHRWNSFDKQVKSEERELKLKH